MSTSICSSSAGYIVVSHTTVPEFFHDIIPLEFPIVTEKLEALAEFYF